MACKYIDVDSLRQSFDDDRQWLRVSPDRDAGEMSAMALISEPFMRMLQHVNFSPKEIQRPPELLRSWSVRAWEVDAEPKVVEVRGRNFQYPSCGDPRRHFFGGASCEKIEGGKVRVTVPGSSSLSRLLVRRGATVSLMEDKFIWRYAASLVAGAICWFYAGELVSVVALIFGAKSYLWDALTLRPAALLAFSLVFAAPLVRRVLADSMREEREESVTYDETRGFYVVSSHRDEMKRRRGVTWCDVVLLKIAGLALMASSSAELYVGIATTVVVVSSPLLYFLTQQSSPSSHGLCAQRRHCGVRSRFTRESLANLREYAQSPSGARDLSKLARHPKHAPIRDAEIEHFLRTGDALHHNCHYR